MNTTKTISILNHLGFLKEVKGVNNDPKLLQVLGENTEGMHAALKHVEETWPKILLSRIVNAGMLKEVEEAYNKASDLLLILSGVNQVFEACGLRMPDGDNQKFLRIIHTSMDTVQLVTAAAECEKCGVCKKENNPKVLS